MLPHTTDTCMHTNARTHVNMYTLLTFSTNWILDNIMKSLKMLPALVSVFCDKETRIINSTSINII